MTWKPEDMDSMKAPLKKEGDLLFYIGSPQRRIYIDGKSTDLWTELPAWSPLIFLGYRDSYRQTLWCYTPEGHTSLLAWHEVVDDLPSYR